MAVPVPQPCYKHPVVTLDTPPLTPPWLLCQRRQIPSFDGSSDLPESEHPNFASFSFNFSDSGNSSTQEREPQLPESSKVEAQSGPPSRARSENSNASCAPALSSLQASGASPDLLRIPSQDRSLVNYSRPSLLGTPSPELSPPKELELTASTDKGQAARKSSSPESNLTPPRSIRIRADDSWLKKDPQKRPKVTEQHNPSDPWPAPLRIRKQSSTVKTSLEFLSKGQPLLSPATPPAATFDSKSPDAKPKLEQQGDSSEPLTEEKYKKTPRITRENILRHILSAESLRELAEVLDSPEFVEEEAEKPRKRPPKMSMLHPESAAAMTEHRREAVRLAQVQGKSVIEKCKRSDQVIPGYTFEELIGKGSYGRVYKGRQTATSKIVAIKVLDVDEADFHAHGEAKDEQIRDFNREIRILRQAQESGAPNMNQIIEALPVHSQLWMICEYCPGGSVKTLMRATNDRLAEKYIVVVARELAKALKGLHDAGIMHRDVKAANVLIHEEGQLQLCDFGVAGVLEQRTDKRRTFIGTLHWMPPELWSDKPEYSDEVDVWEYGVTLYECALGKPPNSDLRERQQLQSRMRRLKQPISLPEHEEFSDGLRSLVKYTLTPDASTRPSMKDVLDHEFLQESEETYPTSSLIQLVQVYYQWLHSGGQRASLFMPGGAVVADAGDSEITPSDEWNFSTTDNFERRNSKLVDIPVLSPSDSAEGEATPKGPQMAEASPAPLRDLTNVQKLNFESRVKRGADLSNLFDQEKPDYEYKIKRDFVPAAEERRISDLPFRAMAEDRPTSIASNVIDLGDFDSDDYAIAAPKREEAIRLADAATIRAKRGDSKGPRDGSTAMNLTARRASSADDSVNRVEASRVATQDFAFPPKEWADDQSPPSSAGTRDLTERPSTRDASRKTMEWTFATAMPSSPDNNEDAQQSPKPSRAQIDKNTKHATLDWSFSNAMAEADAASGAPASRTTPRRPAPLLRTLTQPVTSADFHVAEDFPRPSTSHSEAHSESSLSSADFDPFSLDQGEETPDPAAVDEMNISGYYNTRGRSMGPEHVIPYSSTVAGPAPYMLGRPARVGEEGHPGPPAVLARAATDDSKKSKKKSTSSSSSAGGRPRVEMPEAIPPNEAAMAGNASNEVVESELSRLLGGLQQSLAGATEALGIMRKSKKEERLRKKAERERERGRGSGDEWEDEV